MTYNKIKDILNYKLVPNPKYTTMTMWNKWETLTTCKGHLEKNNFQKYSYEVLNT